MDEGILLEDEEDTVEYRPGGLKVSSLLPSFFLPSTSWLANVYTVSTSIVYAEVSVVISSIPRSAFYLSNSLKFIDNHLIALHMNIFR
jgi:hypothetical protein